MKLTQFKIPVAKDIFVEGEYEGNEKSGKALVFSHGFGVTRNSHGMFDQLGDLIKDEFLVVRFDYTKISEDRKLQYLYPYSIQQMMLEKVLRHIKSKFKIKQLNLLGHSMGGIIVGMLAYPDTYKTILVCSPFESPYKRMKEYFSKREGTAINENSVSKLARSDGSMSILDKNFWPEMKNVDPLSLYKSLIGKTKLYYVSARDDQVLTNQDYSKIWKIKGIKYIKLPGDHDFSGKDRQNWLGEMVKIIKT